MKKSHAQSFIDGLLSSDIMGHFGLVSHGLGSPGDREAAPLFYWILTFTEPVPPNYRGVWADDWEWLDTALWLD